MTSHLTTQVHSLCRYFFKNRFVLHVVLPFFSINPKPSDEDKDEHYELKFNIYLYIYILNSNE